MNNSIKAFNHAIQKANEWLIDLKAIGGFKDEEQAYTALRVVLHALRNRLLPDEAMHLGAQLPMLIRGVYFEGYDIKTPTRHEHLEDFLHAIQHEMRDAVFPMSLEHTVQSVFTLLEEKISAGQINHVLCELPKDLKDMLTGTAQEREN